MSTKPTPGPWMISDNPTETCQIVGADTVRVADVWCTDMPHGAANARLIAAAPDLLRACKAVAEMAVHWEPLTPGDIREVHAAIAKATGSR